MADTFRLPISLSVRNPPPRRAQGTVLNTIMEDSRESHFADQHTGSQAVLNTPKASPRLTLKTSGLAKSSTPTRLARLMSPLSAGTASSCSDIEWQQQMKGFDDLYDATDEEEMDSDDNETDISETCFSVPGTHPSSLVTPITRNSVNSTGSRKRSLTLDIPSSTIWPSINGSHKSSPIPPTPPAKLPVSPAALSMLARSVPASCAPPSLDGSSSYDQESTLRALATPDSQSLPDTSWDSSEIHVRPDLEGSETEGLDGEEGGQDLQTVPIAIESPQNDWRNVLARFPQTPLVRETRTPWMMPNNPSSTEPVEAEPHRQSSPSDSGLFLPDGALAMLHHIRLDGTPEPWSETSESNNEMWQLHAPSSRPRSADGVTPASDMSGYSFSELSIPSPGGFFASLAPRARHTWSIPTHNHPPSSAMAEGFYDLPWRREEEEVVEQIIEWPERVQEEDPITAVRNEEGPPTAIRMPCEASIPSITHHGQDSPMSATFEAVQEITRSECMHEYDDCYDQELQERAAASMDRTSVWLAAQASYLAALNETNPANELDTRQNLDEGEAHTQFEQASAPSRRLVRFAALSPEASGSQPPMFASKDSIFWRGFQSVRQQADRSDGFIHRNMRFDAIQSFRLGLADMHLDCLLGKYGITRPERPAYKGPFSQAPRTSVLPNVLAEKAQFAKLEKEQLVLAQLCHPMWAMDALRRLNGGKLFNSPAALRIARTNTQSSKSDVPRPRIVRILDLGGHATCEWAWHAAYEFPDVKIYSAVSQRHFSNNGIKGPPNHRVIPVSNFWELPFGDNKFDVITARSLHALLKTKSPLGLDQDEYDLVLKECLRCLRPGGFLEFMILDAKISRSGPHATAFSADFVSDLRTRDYDPTASSSFLARLRNGGFVGIKRAWMFLPMAMESKETPPPRETPAPRIPSFIEEYEAVQGPVGSTEDIASVTGLLGGWMWEQWLVHLRMEMGRERAKLLDGIGAVYNEGRKNGAGWTCLSGWAMKPKSRTCIGQR